MGVPLLASLVADHPKSGPSAPISGGLDYVIIVLHCSHKYMFVLDPLRMVNCLLKYFTMYF